MGFERRGGGDAGPTTTGDSESGRTPGRRTLTEGLPARRGGASDSEPAAAHKQGPSSPRALATIVAEHDRILHDIRSVEDVVVAGERGSKNVTSVTPATADHPASGPVADLRVETALAGPIADADRARREAEAHPDDTARLTAYDTAVAALRAAYLESPLYSTDDLSQRGGGAWARSSSRARVDPASSRGPDTVTRADITRWQNANGFVKFVVVQRPRFMALGEGSHIDIAGGPVVAAGLLYFDLHGSGDYPAVSELENVSGGFRPGPLRNETAVAMLTAAGFPHAAAARHDAASGAYDTSQIAPNGTPAHPTRR